MKWEIQADLDFASGGSGISKLGLAWAWPQHTISWLDTPSFVKATTSEPTPVLWIQTIEYTTSNYMVEAPQNDHLQQFK